VTALPLAILQHCWQLESTLCINLTKYVHTRHGTESVLLE